MSPELERFLFEVVLPSSVIGLVVGYVIGKIGGYFIQRDNEKFRREVDESYRDRKIGG